MTTKQLAADTAAITDSAQQYRAMIELNGMLQNMALRRMDVSQIEALRDYAATQAPLPHSNVNAVEWAAKRELAKR